MDSVAEASPATISRCGMLLYETLNLTGVGPKDTTDTGKIVMTGTLDIHAFINSWID